MSHDESDEAEVRVAARAEDETDEATPTGAKARRPLVRRKAARRPAVPGSPKERRSRVPEHEKHVRGIAVLSVLGGVLYVAAGLLMVLAGAGTSVAGGGAPHSLVVGGVIGIMGLVFTGLGMASIGVNVFLFGYHAWARIASIVLTGLTVLMGIVQLVEESGGMGVTGVLWNVLILWVLVSARTKRICTPEYRELVRRSPHIRVAWWTSPFFYLPLALVALVVVGFAAIFGLVAFHR